MANGDFWKLVGQALSGQQVYNTDSDLNSLSNNYSVGVAQKQSAKAVAQAQKQAARTERREVARSKIDNIIQQGKDFIFGDSAPSFEDFVNNAADALGLGDSPLSPATSFGAGSSAASSSDYYQAALASRYGMSAETAYQEALANTAHQREVADLKAAGLNPALGYSGSGASVFNGNIATSSQTGSGRSNSAVGTLGLIGDIVGLAVTLSGKPSVGNSISNIANKIDKKV